MENTNRDKKLIHRLPAPSSFPFGDLHFEVRAFYRDNHVNFRCSELVLSTGLVTDDVCLDSARYVYAVELGVRLLNDAEVRDDER